MGKSVVLEAKIGAHFVDLMEVVAKAKMMISEVLVRKLEDKVEPPQQHQEHVDSNLLPYLKSKITMKIKTPNRDFPQT